MATKEQIKHAWDLLIKAASDRKTYTYGGLGKIVGVHHRGKSMWNLLEPIYQHCKDPKDEDHPNGYPKLTILVVEASTGVPSPSPDGMPEVNESNVAELTEEVFKYDWSAIKQPQIGDFEQYLS